MNNCFICEKKTKSFEDYTVKEGIFSKRTESICENCEGNIEAMYPDNLYHEWYQVVFNGPNYREITKKGLDFVRKNKSKIKNNDRKGLPKCKNCGKRSNYRKMTCEKCNASYCSICDFDVAYEFLSSCELFYDDCPHCFEQDYQTPIIKLLKTESKKMTITDISAFVGQDRSEVKEVLEFMFEKKLIHYSGNGRYFLLDREKKQAQNSPKVTKEKLNLKAELKKFKDLLDNGLINQEDYNAKKKELLGL